MGIFSDSRTGTIDLHRVPFRVCAQHWNWVFVFDKVVAFWGNIFILRSLGPDFCFRLLLCDGMVFVVDDFVRAIGIVKEKS